MINNDLHDVMNLLFDYEPQPRNAKTHGEVLAHLVLYAAKCEGTEASERVAARAVLAAIVDAGYGDVKAPAPPPRPRMNAAQADAFARSLMPWGTHRGESVRSIDREYLAFLVDDSKFRRDLRDYLDRGNQNEADG